MALASQPHMDLHVIHNVPLRDRKLHLLNMYQHWINAFSMNLPFVLSLNTVSSLGWSNVVYAMRDTGLAHELRSVPRPFLIALTMLCNILFLMFYSLFAGTRLLLPLYSPTQNWDTCRAPLNHILLPYTSCSHADHPVVRFSHESHAVEQLYSGDARSPGERWYIYLSFISVNGHA